MSNIKDVARLAGVSIGTVSRYVNGKSVKAANCRRIEEAIRRTGFKINPIARGLKTSRTNTIGVVVPDISSAYGTGIVKHAENYLYKYGYNIITCDTSKDIDLEAQKVELLVQRKVDGLIIYPCTRQLSHLESLLDGKTPVVAVDMGITDFPCDQILTDNINATYEAVAWLFTGRHRRVGIINGLKEYFTSGERYEGFRRAHTDYAVPLDENLVKNTGYFQESGYRSMVELLKLENPPTAVITCNYDTTMGAMGAIFDAGLKVPEQLSVIGFDDLDVFSVFRPKISVVAQPMEKIGQKAAELIVKRIEGSYEGFPEMYRLKTELILRESTKPL